jgi:hypothetical protein
MLYTLYYLVYTHPNNCLHTGFVHFHLYQNIYSSFFSSLSYNMWNLCTKCRQTQSLSYESLYSIPKNFHVIISPQSSVKCNHRWGKYGWEILNKLCNFPWPEVIRVQPQLLVFSISTSIVFQESLYTYITSSIGYCWTLITKTTILPWEACICSW